MSQLDFEAFFRAIHGVAPLPWQSRLARELVTHHTWPDVIDLPTASGKTACLDIALYHLAWCALRGEPGLAARRIAFVVDRRIIVDAAAERAERIRLALEARRSEAVRAVADGLLRLGGNTPLACVKLRGGMARESGAVLHPAQPMIITSTVDQVGSRLLFRGYGVSPYSLSVHAGLLGHDTLILLDEAHLGEPFVEAVSAVAREQRRAQRPLGAVKTVEIVPMSATSRSSGVRFSLDRSDLEHPVITQRRTAPKPARLVKVSKAGERLKVLAKEATEMLAALEGAAPSVALIVNRVKTARELFERLREESARRDFEIQLLIGRSRPLDRDVLAKRLLDRVQANREPQDSDRPLLVVATQTLEVGADLDFQGMVTECAALDALRQRFGRLDRLGLYRKARAVIVGGDEGDDDPVYGPALGETWRWLEASAVVADGSPTVDFAIEAMDRALAGVDTRPLTGRSPQVLPLTPAFVQLLCQTSARPVYEPDVAKLLHGLEAAAPEVQVVWRTDLPVIERRGDALLDDGRIGVARALLDLNPPMSLEAVSLPIRAVRAWLETSKEDAQLADIEGPVDDAPSAQPSKSPPSRPVLRRSADEWEIIPAHHIRPGDTIVVPSAYGGCDEFGFAPQDRTPVRDLSAQARHELGRSPLFVASRATLAALKNPEPNGAEALAATWGRICEEHASDPTADPGRLIDLLLEDLGEALPADLSWLRERPVVRAITSPGTGGELRLEALIATGRQPRRGDISDEDLSSSHTVPVPLDTHSAGVGRRARTLAEAVGLSAEHIKTLGCAGELHDVGKAEPRFQALLRAGDHSVLPGQLLAKGVRRGPVSGVELGERHEAYSVALIRAHAGLLEGVSDPELAEYLVGTHHGRGRALMPDRPDEGAAFDVNARNQACSFDGAPRLGALGSDWAGLFWRLNRRYGPWGLAYLEAVLRLADRLQSEDELQGAGEVRS